MIGGSYESILARLQKSGGDVEYLDGVRYAENPVLYRLERSR